MGEIHVHPTLSVLHKVAIREASIALHGDGLRVILKSNTCHRHHIVHLNRGFHSIIIHNHRILSHEFGSVRSQLEILGLIIPHIALSTRPYYIGSWFTLRIDNELDALVFINDAVGNACESHDGEVIERTLELTRVRNQGISTSLHILFPCINIKDGRSRHFQISFHCNQVGTEFLVSNVSAVGILAGNLHVHKHAMVNLQAFVERHHTYHLRS